MSYSLDLDTMKKTFLMGDEGSRFTHKSAQRIKLFPFIANNNALIIKSLSSVVGEWLRLIKKQQFAIPDVDSTVKEIVDNVDCDEPNKEKLTHIIKELFWNEHDQLRPNSINAMCYIPVTDPSEEKMAQYLYSVLSSEDQFVEIVDRATEKSANQANVLEKAVMEALHQENESATYGDKYYPLHSASQNVFFEDLKFILDNTSRTKDYLVDLLEFYYFFYTSQSCLMLDRFEHGSRFEIVPLYFSLDWEKTNKARECYKYGWIQLQPSINNLFYHAITLEILNQNTTGKQYDYIALKEIADIEDNHYIAAQIQAGAELYRNAIRSISQPGECEEFNNIQKNYDRGIVFCEIQFLFDSVKMQFERTSRGRANNAYVEKFMAYCHDNFLKRRGQSGLMLNITEEELIFLTKLVIKNNDQMSLNEVFKQFECRGIFFDSSSKEEIIKFYSKLNLIDKKSDSGDAQYVKRFL